MKHHGVFAVANLISKYPMTINSMVDVVAHYVIDCGVRPTAHDISNFCLISFGVSDEAYYAMKDAVRHQLKGAVLAGLIVRKKDGSFEMTKDQRERYLTGLMAARGNRVKRRQALRLNAFNEGRTEEVAA